MNKTDNGISVRDFTFRYCETGTPALQNINLEVRPGELVVLSGKSGCGKTTLMRSLNGIIPHLLPGETEGEVIVSGQNIRELSPEKLSGIAGSVFQNPRSQFFHINVTDEIAFGPESLGLKREDVLRRVDEAFALFEIDHLRERKMYELSSGEQQKVSFAAIYCTGADIFFLDEPSANLDSQSIQSLKRILGILKDRGKTLVVAEHRLYYLADLFDKIVVLKQGWVDKVFTREDRIDNDIMQAQALRVLDLKAAIEKMEALPYETGRREDTTLSVRDVSFAYSRKGSAVLDAVSLDLVAGEKLAIIGPNGSGKTTLTRLVAGLLSPSGGAFRNSSGGKLSSSRRLHTCGLVLQENSHQLFFSTVRAELDSVLSDADSDFALELLRDLGLEEFLDTHPQNLSAGQQQRLVFAIAAANSPSVLILDEPTSGLDAYSMRAMGNKINEESRKGATVLIVTHDYEFVSRYCDAAIMLCKGHPLRRIERKEFKSDLPVFN